MAIGKSNWTSDDVTVEATSFSPLFQKRYFTLTVEYNENIILFPTED